MSYGKFMASLNYLLGRENKGTTLLQNFGKCLPKNQSVILQKARIFTS